MEKSTLKNMKFGKEKLQNFWYFYKWRILAAILILAVCGGMLVQCLKKEDADVYIYWAGPVSLTKEAQKKISEAFQVVIPDDCAQTVGLLTTVYGSKATVGNAEDEKQQTVIDYTGQKETLEEFKSRMRLPDFAICILSLNCYEIAKQDTGTLRPLSEIFETLPEGTNEEGLGIPLAELPFYKSNSALQLFPQNSVLCLKSRSVFMDEKSYEKQVAAFCALVSFGRTPCSS